MTVNPRLNFPQGMLAGMGNIVMLNQFTKRLYQVKPP